MKKTLLIFTLLVFVMYANITPAGDLIPNRSWNFYLR